MPSNSRCVPTSALRDFAVLPAGQGLQTPMPTGPVLEERPPNPNWGLREGFTEETMKIKISGMGRNLLNGKET